MRTVASPETPLADIFAMPVETLIVASLKGFGTTVTLRITGGNTVKVHGDLNEPWQHVLAEAMELAAEDRRAHA